MTETGKMIVKLTVLIIPVIALFCTLYPWQKGTGTGIGGGSYDLSEMVYGSLFTLFLACWNIWVLVSLLIAKTQADKLNNKILLAIGLVIFSAALIWFFKQLR